jgi:hypothetical protein
MVRKYDPGYDFRSSESLRQRDERRQRDRSRHAALVPSVTTEGQRPCARGEHCARSTVTVLDNGTSRREPALGYQAFCPADEAAIAAALAGMPRQYAHLLAEIGNPARRGQVIRVPFGPRIPLRLDIDSLTRFTREILSCWEERVRTTAGRNAMDTEESRHRRELVAVRDSAQMLVGNLSVLLALQPEPVDRTMDLMEARRIAEDGLWAHLLDGTIHVSRTAGMAGIIAVLDGAHAGTEILTLEYLARAVLGQTRPRPEELEGVPCRDPEGGCGWRTLVRAELPSREDEPVWWSLCTRCGDKMTEPEYREWVALCAAYERHRARTPETLDELPVVA